MSLPRRVAIAMVISSLSKTVGGRLSVDHLPLTVPAKYKGTESRVYFFVKKVGFWGLQAGFEDLAQATPRCPDAVEVLALLGCQGYTVAGLGACDRANRPVSRVMKANETERASCAAENSRVRSRP